jgi:DNA repair exonuclease SbcCD ATPase subunit
LQEERGQQEETMDTPIGNAGFGTTSATERANTAGSTCTACGQPLRGSGVNSVVEELLGRLGLSDEMIDNLRTSMANVDVEEYLNTAREYLQANSGKAKEYARENPGKVAAGVAVLAVGAGLLFSALSRD